MTQTAQTRVLPWWQPVMGEREKILIAEVIDQGFPNDGRYSDRFAAQIAEICGAPYALAVTSGTAALALAVMALGVGPGDEVLVPDVTFIATANAVNLAGARPVLVDVEPQTGLLSLEAAEAAITPRTRAVIPVHVSGRAVTMPALMQLAEHYHLAVIEDAAEALGSRQAGRPLGSWGISGCFSLSPAKIITTGQGGIITTHDEAFYKKLVLLKDQGRPVRGTGGADEHVAAGYNFKFTNLQGAMGLAQLEDIEDRLEHQRQLYHWYARHFPQSDKVRLLPFDIQGGEVPQWIDMWAADRDSLHDYLEANHAHPRKFWYPLHTQPPYKQHDRAFPNAVEFTGHALWLPSALPMTEDDVIHVCGLIDAWLGITYGE